MSRRIPSWRETSSAEQPIADVGTNHFPCRKPLTEFVNFIHRRQWADSGWIGRSDSKPALWIDIPPFDGLETAGPGRLGRRLGKAYFATFGLSTTAFQSIRI